MTTNIDPSAHQLCYFLAKYSAMLLGVGATCIRLSKNAGRIAKSYGYTIVITIMPRYVQISILSKDGAETVTASEQVPNVPISFNINAQLSQLSWHVSDHHLSLDEVEHQYERIIHSDCQNPWLILLLASLANASFCHLFGGDSVAMGIVFVATAAGLYLKQVLLAKHIDIKVVFTLCSFLSAIIATSDQLFLLGPMPTVTLGTSVLYLVPGIPFLNSFSDMLYRHYICSIVRFIDATILTCCLSAGLCIGMYFMRIGMF